MRLISFSLIQLEWNRYNGPFFHILEIETERFDRALLSFWTDGKKIEIDLVFIHFRID